MPASNDPLSDRVTRGSISVFNEGVVDSIISARDPNTTGVVSVCTLSTSSSGMLLRGVVVSVSVRFSEDTVVVRSTSFCEGSTGIVEDSTFSDMVFEEKDDVSATWVVLSSSLDKLDRYISFSIKLSNLDVTFEFCPAISS